MAAAKILLLPQDSDEANLGILPGAQMLGTLLEAKALRDSEEGEKKLAAASKAALRKFGEEFIVLLEKENVCYFSVLSPFAEQYSVLHEACWRVRNEAQKALQES